MREVAERKPIKKTEPKKEAVRETIGTGKEEKKAEKTGKGIPAYLVVLLVVLAVVGSYAVFLLLDSDSPPNGSNGNGGKEGIVRVKLLYSNECVFCRNHNTILDVFDAKGIPFEVERIEMSSPKGKELVANFFVQVSPTALVPVEDMEAYNETSSSLKKAFAVVNGYFVVPEVNLDNSKIYSRMFLAPQSETDCNSLNGIAEIILFDDPFNELSIKQSPIERGIERDFNDFISLSFEYLPSSTSTLFPDANTEARDYLIDYFVCSNAEGKYSEFHNELLSIYCDTDGSEQNFSNLEIVSCNSSPHFGKPLAKEEVERAASRAGLSEGTIATCFNFVEDIKKTSLQRASEYGIRVIGTALVECRYNVPIQTIDDAICLELPEIEPCQKIGETQGA